MKSLFYLVLSSLRRSTAAYILMGISIFIASFLLSVSLGIMFNLGSSFDTMLELMNGGNLVLEYNLDQYPPEELENWWKARKEVEMTEEYPVYKTADNIQFNGETLEMTAYIAERKITDLSIDQLIRIESSSGEDEELLTPGKGELWAPAILKNSHDLKIGDSIGIPTARGISLFRVSAFVADPQYNSSWGLKRFWIREGDLYTVSSPLFYSLRLLSVRVRNPEDIETLLHQFDEYLGDTFQGHPYLYEEIKSDYLIILNIVAIILGIIAAISLIISITVLSGNLSSFIRSEYKQIGLARAIGFSSVNIVSVYLLQIILLSLTFTLLGVLSGRSMTGLLLHFMLKNGGLEIGNASYLFSTVITLTGIPLFISIFCLKQITATRKIKPSLAISQGYTAGEKKKRRIIKLEKSNIRSAPLFLSLRNLAKGKESAVYTLLSFILTVFITSISLNTSGLLANSLSDNQFWGIADPDISFTREGTLFSEIGDREIQALLLNYENVESICTFSSQLTAYVRKTETENPFLLTGYAVSDKMEAIGLVNISGDHPLKLNEIAITDRTADKYGIVIGDPFTLFIDGMDHEFIVSGIFQNSDNRGFSFRFSDETYRSISASYQPAEYNIRLTDPKLASLMLDKIEAELGMFLDGVLKSNTIIELENDFASNLPYVYILFTLISIIFFIISFVIIQNDSLQFIMDYRTSFGILKSLGMTPYQLKAVLVLRILILLAASLAIGFPAGVLLSPSLLNLAFGSSGFGAFTPAVRIGNLLMLIPVFLLFGIFSAFIPARGLSKIQAKELMRN